MRAPPLSSTPFTASVSLPIRPITTAVDANRSQRQPQDLALRPGQAVRRPDELIDVAGVQVVAPDLDLLGTHDPRPRAVAVIAEGRVVGDLLKRPVLPVGVDDHHRGPDRRSHELLDDHASEVALAGARAGR